METGAKKILETTTIKTLHAHGFAKSSTQANLVLADVLSRYLTQLSTTAAKYAEHVGRRTPTARGVVEAFEELGTLLRHAIWLPMLFILRKRSRIWRT